VLESVTEVAEVSPGGVGRDEVPCNVVAGVVVDGEQEDLFLLGWPPLVDGAVVLPEFAESGPAKAAE